MDYVVGLLSVLLVIQQIFWAKVCYGLVNRLMSRSFHEYEQAKALKFPSVPQIQVDEVDYESERQAQDLNSLMGVV